MPYTLNGIGTHYYGAANRSARVDVCQSCGRSATLSSYDTREFFCIVFIPIIPLGKYRILNDCSSCRRHHRVSAADFAQQVDDRTAPLREAIRRSPRDPQPYVDLVSTLIGWEMRADAERELESAIAGYRTRGAHVARRSFASLALTGTRAPLLTRHSLERSIPDDLLYAGSFIRWSADKPFQSERRAAAGTHEGSLMLERR